MMKNVERKERKKYGKQVSNSSSLKVSRVYKEFVNMFEKENSCVNIMVALLVESLQNSLHVNSEQLRPKTRYSIILE